MSLKFSILPPFFFLFLFFSVSLLLQAESLNDEDASGVGSLVKREERQFLARTEFGEISAVQVSDGSTGPYYLQFITLDPNSLFLPVLLHACMVFYVRSGSGRLSWTDEGDLKRVKLRRGDIYRLQPGSVFYLESNLELGEREKLRIYAMFSNTEEEDEFEPSIGAYTSISDLVLGFDIKVLASAFKVPEDVIEAITNATKPPAIVHALPEKKTTLWQLEDRFLKAFLVGRGGLLQAEGSNKMKTYNIFDAKPDFGNCNGWSLTVDKKHLKLLKHTNIGLFMVNLTKGSMMGPHWNPMASELAIVIQGQGMVRVVCPSTPKQSDCEDMRFKVGEGDVFAVPRFHPMAQMSFNNDSFVFMGFSTSTKRNHPQFLAGKNSVLHALNKRILALSFNVTNKTIDQLLTPQRDSVILECTSCAEEEERAMEEEIQEEEKRREEEEEKKREEEEAKKRREEEEAKKREEEEKKREEEEKRREEEEAKKREEEEARKREEEKKKREEEEAKKREEEEARKREEEAKKREEEEAKRREEAAARKREEEEAKRREEAAARKREEEEARKEAEEEEAARKAAEEEAKRREEEEARKREQEEARKREEEARREQEEARKQEEEREREARREQEEARKEDEERVDEGGEGRGRGEEQQPSSRQGGGEEVRMGREEY